MKPKEFDELIRQKFDQNDFEYDSRNWDVLAEKLGPSKKRSIAIWWWMPLAAGIAASVALAIGFISMWQGQSGNAGVAEFAQAFTYSPAQPVHDTHQSITADNIVNNVIHRKAGSTVKKNIQAAAPEEDNFGINLENAIGYTPARKTTRISLLEVPEDSISKKKDKKKDLKVTSGIATFKPEEAEKTPKVSITLLGGITQGSMNSGYVAGATVRRMLNDKVYIESDIAFESSNNTQGTLVPGQEVVAASRSAARSTDGGDNLPTTQIVTPGTPLRKNETYNLSYAQVTPSIGIKIMKRLSLAAGPDFQQALADNRPAPATNLTFNNIAVMPLFDIGMVGKTEYSVTRKVKAQVSYRKGINNVLTPMDKYIDRNYLQVQVKCMIFNK